MIKDFLAMERKREEKEGVIYFMGRTLQFFALILAFIVFVGSLLFQREKSNGLDCEDN